MTEPEFLKQWHDNFPKHSAETKQMTNCPYPTARTCPLDPETGKFQSSVVER